MNNTKEKFDPSAVLADALPSFLAEGPMLIEFKTDSDTDVKPSLIVTRSDEYCRIDDIPVDNCDDFNIWAWNLHRGGWVLIDLKEVDAVQTWPPEDLA